MPFAFSRKKSNRKEIVQLRNDNQSEEEFPMRVLSMSVNRKNALEPCIKEKTKINECKPATKSTNLSTCGPDSTLAQRTDSFCDAFTAKESKNYSMADRVRSFFPFKDRHLLRRQGLFSRRSAAKSDESLFGISPFDFAETKSTLHSSALTELSSQVTLVQPNSQTDLQESISARFAHVTLGRSTASLSASEKLSMIDPFISQRSSSLQEGNLKARISDGCPCIFEGSGEDNLDDLSQLVDRLGIHQQFVHGEGHEDRPIDSSDLPSLDVIPIDPLSTGTIEGEKASSNFMNMPCTNFYLHPFDFLLPVPLAICFERLKAEINHTEKLFQTSGSERTIKGLLLQLRRLPADDAELGPEFFNKLPFSSTAYDVATIVKRYIGCLQGGPLEIYWNLLSLLAIMEDWPKLSLKEKQLSEILAYAIASIPSRAYRNLTCAMFALLDQYIRAQSNNRASNIRNVSIIFAPLLFGHSNKGFPRCFEDLNELRSFKSGTVTSTITAVPWMEEDEDSSLNFACELVSAYLHNWALISDILKRPCRFGPVYSPHQTVVSRNVSKVAQPTVPYMDSTCMDDEEGMDKFVSVEVVDRALDIVLDTLQPSLTANSAALRSLNLLYTLALQSINQSQKALEPVSINILPQAPSGSKQVTGAQPRARNNTFKKRENQPHSLQQVFGNFAS